jgi:hypothetical protein
MSQKTKRNLQNPDCTFQFGPKGSFSDQYVFFEKNLISVKADQKFVEPAQSFHSYFVISKQLSQPKIGCRIQDQGAIFELFFY